MTEREVTSPQKCKGSQVSTISKYMLMDSLEEMDRFLESYSLSRQQGRNRKQDHTNHKY